MFRWVRYWDSGVFRGFEVEVRVNECGGRVARQ